MEQQLSFDWLATPKIPAPSPRASAVPTTSTSAVERPAIRRTAATPKRVIRDRVELYFKERKIAYVNVAETKRVLLSGSMFGTFHFVAYPKNGPNWIVWAAQMRSNVRENMTGWEKIFGEGFVAVVAKEQASGELSFRKLDGTAMEIA